MPFTLAVTVTVTDCGCPKLPKQTSDGREDVQMEEVSKGKEEVDDAALTSLPKPHPPGKEKKEDH